MAMEDGVDGALNVAGYWTIGVVKGFLIVIVPMAMVGAAYGMGKRVMDTSIRFFGGGE